MRWTDSTSKHVRHERAVTQDSPANERLFSILGTSEDDNDLDRSRPVPWDYPDEPRHTLS